MFVKQRSMEAKMFLVKDNICLNIRHSLITIMIKATIALSLFDINQFTNWKFFVRRSNQPRDTRHAATTHTLSTWPLSEFWLWKDNLQREPLLQKEECCRIMLSWVLLGLFVLNDSMRKICLINPNCGFAFSKLYWKVKLGAILNSRMK